MEGVEAMESGSDSGEDTDGVNGKCGGAGQHHLHRAPNPKTHHQSLP